MDTRTRARTWPTRLFRLAVLATMLAYGAASAAISAPERGALLDLYGSTNGSGWVNSAGWGGAAGTECAWFGVICAADGNSVGQLWLANNNLAGPLPPSLQDLSHLNLLFLGNNHITGTIPPLAEMNELTDFGIGSNLVDGPIPAIGSLGQLALFDVGNNNLSGPLPDLTGLTRLYLFDASDNQLGGGLPALSTLAALTSFNVSDNRLSGPVPSLAGLDRLQAFYISDNQLDGLPPAIPDPSALVDNGSRLCPNALIAVTSPEWDAATGTTPWYQDCASDDLIFRDGFETLP